MTDVNNHVAFAQPIPRNPGHFLTIADVTEAIAEPGEDRAKLHATLRQFAAQGYLFAPYRETGSRGAYLYTPATCIVCAVLVRLNEMGIRNADACRAVANALYTHKVEDCPGGRAPRYMPGRVVLSAFLNGDDDWTVELWTLRHDNGQIVHAARLYKPRAGRGPGLGYDLSKFAQRAVLAVDLADVLNRMSSQGLVN